MSVPVIIAGLGGGSHGEQVLKSLRLAATDYFVVGADMDPHAVGLSHVDIAYSVPSARSPDYVEALLTIAARHGAVALIHGSEPDLLRMSAERDVFAAAGLFLPINSAEVIDRCMDKQLTARFLEAAGFRTPRAWELATLDDCDAVDVFPVVVKPYRAGGGSADVYVAQTRDDLMAVARLILPTRPHLMIQEYVGTPESEYTVGILSGPDGAYLNGIAVRRLLTSTMSVRIRVPNRSGRLDLGANLVISNGVSQGNIGRFPEVVSVCRRVAEQLGSRGPLNIQCRLVGSDVLVFEINPRLSGTSSLRAMAGFNEADVLIRRYVFGEPIEPDWPYEEGLVLRSLAETFIRAEPLAWHADG